MVFLRVTFLRLALFAIRNHKKQSSEIKSLISNMIGLSDSILDRTGFSEKTSLIINSQMSDLIG